MVISFWPPADPLRLVFLDGLAIREVPEIGGSTRNATSLDFLSTSLQKPVASEL
jgi:hypothetical protein